MFLNIIFLIVIILTAANFFQRNRIWEKAMLSSIAILILTIAYGILTFHSGYNGGIVSTSNINLVGSIGISFSTGASALTIALLTLTAIIMPISIYTGKNEHYTPLFYGLLMLTELGLYGLLISRNFIFFYIFWHS